MSGLFAPALLAVNLILFGALIASIYWKRQLHIALDLYVSAADRAAYLADENHRLMEERKTNAVEKVRDQRQMPQVQD